MKTTRIAACAGLLALTATLMTVGGVDAGAERGPRGRDRPVRGPGQHPGRGGPAQVLDLTADQRAQFEALRETFHAEALALRQSGDADREAFKALRASHREQFEALLTHEQKAQLAARHAERQASRPEGARGPREGRRPGYGREPGPGSQHMGPRGERPDLGAALGLSPEQATQMQALRTDLRAQMRALRESGEGSREQAQALFAAHHEQMLTLLTEAQRATLEQLHAARPEGGRFGRHGDAATPVAATDAAEKPAGSTPGRSWGSVKSGKR